MPELPEVETTMRAMRARLCGRRIDGVGQWRADLRFPLPPLLPERLEGRRIDAFERRAKYIVMHLSEGLTALMHLGMSGRFLFDGESRGMHEHLTFRFDDGSVLRYVDPRRFGMLDLVPTAEWRAHRWIAHLGFEPLDPAFDGAALQSCLKNRLQAVKTAIMDQRMVVGVGNIYASERLFRAGVLPYYLHLLDRVQGAAHFEVAEDRASQLITGVSARLPGYLVPKLVREVAGAAAKTPAAMAKNGG